MISPELARIQELLEKAEEQKKIGDRIHAEAKREIEEGLRRRRAIYARIRAEREHRNKPFLRRLREALFPG